MRSTCSASPLFFESDAGAGARAAEAHASAAAEARREEAPPHQLGERRLGAAVLEEPGQDGGRSQAAKLYTTEGDDRWVRWYSANGFRAVPLAPGEIPKQLKLPTGAINAAPLPPVWAVALKIFRDAPYMLDLPVAPLVAPRS